MADTLVERVTGQATATAVPVEVQLVMTDAALLGEDPTPAHLHGYGPVPAPWPGPGWPTPPPRCGCGGSTPARPSRPWSRWTPPGVPFTGGLRRFLITRDQTCRTPWCDAPIRHVDHPTRHADGGPTTAGNGQGLCAACNLAKEAPGWRARTGGNGEVHTHTPTGHHYASPVPPNPVAHSVVAGPSPARSRAPSHLEARLDDLLPAA